MFSHSEDFLEIVYEAAFDETKWSLVMDHVCEDLNAEMAVLRRINARTLIGESVVGRLDSAMIPPFLQYYQFINPVNTPAALARARSLGATRIGRDTDRVPKEEFTRSEFYNDFFKVFDVHADMWLRLTASDQTALNLNVMRSQKRGDWASEDVARCAVLGPHLARAAKLGERVGALRALGEDLAEVLDRSPYSLILLDDRGTVRRMNRAAERLVGQHRGLLMRRGKIEGSQREESHRLTELIRRAGAPSDQGRVGGSMAIAGEDGELKFSIIVAPLGAGQAPGLFGGPAIAICVTDHEAGVAMPEQRLRDLFGLTCGEARVATALLEGLSPIEAAARLDIGIATVRFHLSRILEKTRCRGQVELCQLLMRTVGIGIGVGEPAS